MKKIVLLILLMSMMTFSKGFVVIAVSGKTLYRSQKVDVTVDFKDIKIFIFNKKDRAVLVRDFNNEGYYILSVFKYDGERITYISRVRVVEK